MKSKTSNPLLALLAITAMAFPASAATYYWDGTDTTANADGGAGDWNTILTNWDTAATAGTNIAWTSANVASFGGTGGAVTVDAGGISAERLLFTATGYTLSGGDLAVTAGGTTDANAAFNVTAGSVATINNKITSTNQLWVGGGGKLVLGNTTNSINSWVVSGASSLEVSDFAQLGGGGFFFNNNFSGTHALIYTGASASFTNFHASFGMGGGTNEFRVTQAGTTVTMAQNIAPNSNGAFHKSGAGTLMLTGNNTFSGGIAVREGSLQIGGASGTIASQAVTIGNSTISGKLVLGDASNTKSITVNNLTTSGTGSANAVVGANAANSTLIVNTTTFGNFIGTIGGAGTNENNINLTKNGVGVLTMDGSSTLAGKVTVNAGLLGIRYGTELGTPVSAVADQITLNGGTLMNMTNASSTASFGSGWSPTLGVNVGITLGASGGTFRVGYAAKLFTVNGVISGAGNLTKTDGSELVLGGDNTFTGDTKWTNTSGYGTIKLTHVNALKNSTVDMTNGTLNLNSLDNVVLGGLKGTGALDVGTKTVKVGNNNATTNYSGALYNGTVNKIGNGESTLSGTGDNAALKAVVDTGTLVLAKTSSALVHTVGSTNVAGLTINGGTARLGGTGGDQIFSASLVHMTGGTFDLAAQNEGFRGLTGTAGTVTNDGASASVLTVGESSVAADSYTFAGSIINGTTSTVALTKTGSGKQTLSSTSSYTGATQVNAGTLLIGTGGSLGSSAVTVGGSTATGTPTLGGVGTIGGATIIATADGGATGTHAPGIVGDANGVGTQTFTSTLNYQTGSIFEWDLQAISTTDPGAAASNSATGTYDQVVASGSSGSVTGSAAVFKVVLGGNAFTDVFWNTNKSWSNIFSGTGSPSNLASIFTSFSNTGGLSAGDGTVADRGQFTFTGSTLNWTAVPEPTSALTGLLIGAGLLRRRRR